MGKPFYSGWEYTITTAVLLYTGQIAQTVFSKQPISPGYTYHNGLNKSKTQMPLHGIARKILRKHLENFQIHFFIVIAQLRIFINLLSKERRCFSIVGLNGFMDLFKICLLNCYLLVVFISLLFSLFLKIIIGRFHTMWADYFEPFYFLILLKCQDLILIGTIIHLFIYKIIHKLVFKIQVLSIVQTYKILLKMQVNLLYNIPWTNKIYLGVTQLPWQLFLILYLGFLLEVES